MIFSDEDKKMVDQYKQTNILLRKQLNNLNIEIDRLLQKHSNKVGLQKMPQTQKKITDPKILQLEVENLRKRVELLEKDEQIFKEKAKNNYHVLTKEAQTRIQQQQTQAQQIKKMIKQFQRKDKIADVVASKQEKNKTWDKKISFLQQQLARSQKLQKQLAKQLSIQAVLETKATNQLHEVANRHHETIVKIEKQRRKSHDQQQSPSNNNKNMSPKKQQRPSEQDWKRLKIQFLTFKQAKQNQQTALNVQNQQLRGQIKQWSRKIKQKEQRIGSIRANQQKNRIRVRNYSTLQESNKSQSRVEKQYRYRDRNNSVNYTKQ